jgi:serine/threonine protein phosphatase PrpC
MMGKKARIRADKIYDQDAEPAPVSTPSAPIGLLPAIGSERSNFFGVDWFDRDKNWHRLAADGPTSDIHCEAGFMDNIAVLGTTIRGWKHRYASKGNEDWFTVQYATGTNGMSYIISAVCDGLSSARYSGYAARKASSLVARGIAQGITRIDEFNERNFEQILSLLLETVAKQLRTWTAAESGSPAADCNDVEDSDLLCTLTVSIMTTQTDERGLFHLFTSSIGDSPVLKLSNGEWSRLEEEDERESTILSNQTHAFPIHHECRITKHVVKRGEVIVSASDGIGNFVLRNGRTMALGTFFAEHWREPVDLLTFLTQMSFDLKSADDDRTAVVFWPI